jgi:hypothetical protein
MSARTVLVVSPHFPPSTLAGVHRARHMAKHLPAFGWRPIVVCVDERFHTEALDPDLAALVPASVERVKTSAIPAPLARRVGVGDIGIRGYHALRRALGELIPRERPEVVFITGSPFYPLLLSGWIRRRFGVPVVLDLQDPWVSDWGAQQKPFTKVWAAHRLARALEPRAVRHAAFVTSVSDTQNAQMAARYPWMDASRMAAIPIGGDPEDFDALRRTPPPATEAPLDPARLEFSYVGAFLPRAAPLARVLFAALARLRRDEPDLAARMRLNFIGSSNQPNDRTTFRVAPLAAEAGVGDLVREVPQRIPFLHALSTLANSHAVLMIGSDEAHYTASKIYPAMMSGRPWLSIFHAQSSSHAILSRAGGGAPLAFASPQELAALEGPMAEALARLAREPDSFGAVDRAAYAPYEARAVAGAFAAVFDRVAGEG